MKEFIKNHPIESYDPVWGFSGLDYDNPDKEPFAYYSLRKESGDKILSKMKLRNYNEKLSDNNISDYHIKDVHMCRYNTKTF